MSNEAVPVVEKQALEQVALTALADLKAHNVKSLHVASLTSVTDYMIVATGTSNRHVKSVANSVIESSKKVGVVPLGVEGGDAGDWVLVDLGDVVVHVMLDAVREFYNIEKMWDIPAPTDELEVN